MSVQILGNTTAHNMMQACLYTCLVHPYRLQQTLKMYVMQRSYVDRHVQSVHPRTRFHFTSQGLPVSRDLVEVRFNSKLHGMCRDLVEGREQPTFVPRAD
jgi:hypothetical protein